MNHSYDEKLKQDVIDHLRSWAPLTAAVIKCLNLRLEDHPVKPTVHITAKKQDHFFLEQIQNKYMLERVFSSVTEVLEREVNLTFERPT